MSIMTLLRKCPVCGSTGWIEGAPTEPGVYVCQSDLDPAPRFWLANVRQVIDEMLITACAVSIAAMGNYRGHLADFVSDYRITHHFPINPQPPSK